MNPSRQSLLAQVHIAKKALGLDDDTYRAVLWEQVKRESAGKATTTELQKLLRHFESKGWQKKRRGGGLGGDSPQVRKIRALWLDLAEAGVVKNASEMALRFYIKRQTGVEHPAWLNGAQASAVIESLKRWAARTGTEVE